MTSPAGETTGFAGRLAQAIELAEDGDLEESEELFKTLIAGGGGTAEAALAYAKTLRKLGRLPEADALLTQAIAAAPENFALRQAWSEIPRHEVNYAGTIARGRTLRKLFPPEHYPESWESFSVELDSLYEMGEWDQLENLVRQHWEDFLIHPEILPDAISALNKLFLHQDLARLAETAAPTAWTKLPPEAKANILNRTAAAARHHDAISHSGIKIISIGQNCLPYQLAGRWGFLGARADQAGLTPFDLGGFTNDSAAAAITTSFDIFARREDFKVTTAWGGGKMFLHQPTGIGFFHERGSHWVTPDGARFFTRLALMMTNWQLAQRAPRRLYVFSLCGAGELATLVHAAAEKLLDANAHLLILDVMQTPHQCPFHPQVTYRHLPYPKDYDWSSVFQQTSPAGFAFEQAVTSAISDALASLDPAAPGQAGDHALAREKIISKTWRFGPANGLALTETFRFGGSGQIEGYENDNEAYWTCDNGRLNIFKRSGEIMWTATAITQATPAQITLTTPHNENLKFFLTESNTTAAPSRRHLYTAKPRILILDNGLDIAARLPATLAHAQITRITSPDEIDAHESCNVFISSLVLSHARTRADAAAFISRATARFPLTIFIELSAHNAAYLSALGLRSFHQGFAENTFMDQLSVEFCAQAASASGIYKIEHFAANPAFDTFKEWIVPASHPPGTYHHNTVEKQYHIFDRPVFELSIYACHAFDALDLPLAQDLTLIEMRALRLRAESSGFRLNNIARPAEIGRLLYNTSTNAPPAWRARPISLPAMPEPHETPKTPLHRDILEKWRAEFKIEIAELSVYQLNNCAIAGTGTIFASQKFVFGTDYLLMFLNASSLDPIMRGLQRRHPTQHIEGLAIIGLNALYDNYYHFAAEALASISLCLDLLAASNLQNLTLITGKLNATRREYLELLLKNGPRLRIIELERDQFITATTILYCDNLGRQVHQQVCWEEIPLAQKIIAAAAPAAAAPHRKLYIARTDTKGRAMTNEPELITQLAAQGFEIFIGGEHKVAAQVQTFREARFIVAPHGAGLTNLLYCHPGTIVLELHQSAYLNTGMMRLAQLNHLHYYADLTFVPENEMAAGTWSIDTSRILKTISELTRRHFPPSP